MSGDGMVLIGLLSIALILNIIKTLSGKDWSCLLGLHRYSYAYEKHGMHTNNGKLVGTRRKVYKCRCGKHKPIGKGDWL